MICASLTWLRHHKSSQFETSIQSTADAYKDEPSWIVENLLRRKREDLVTRWEDREKRLETLRLKERALEERGRKRRRIEETYSSGTRAIDEDAEWLLDDLDTRDDGPKDALSGLSKESRDVLTRMGLGAPQKQDEDEDVFEEQIKVWKPVFITCDAHIVTLVDLLHVKNTFSTITVHHRTAPSYISTVNSTVGRQTRRIHHRTREIITALISPETLH